MKIFFIYGYVLGLTLASPITRFQECKVGFGKIDNNKNIGDHHAGRIPKNNSPMPSLFNKTVTDENEEKKVEASVKTKTSGIGIKHHNRRDLNHLTQKLPKRQKSVKKQRPKKLIQSHSVNNRSSKIQDIDIFKHMLEKGSIIKQLQKRSIYNEDTPSDPYHSPDISYDWDTQEDLSENEQDESAGLTKSMEDLTPNVTNENNDPNYSSQSDHTSSNESNNPNGSTESSSPAGENEISYESSSNDSDYKSKSEESTNHVTNGPGDFQESSEPIVENSDSKTSVSETTDELSESKLSNESWNSDKSGQTSQHNESSNSSDSISNESSDSSDDNISSNSSEPTAHSDNSTENSSQYIEGTVKPDDTDENEIDS